MLFITPDAGILNTFVQSVRKIMFKKVLYIYIMQSDGGETCRFWSAG